MTLAAAANVLGGDIHGADVQFSGVSTDSRSIRRGELFVALRGERFDGHRFLSEVATAGASAALVEHGHAAAAPLPVVAVADTTAALAALAAHWRRRFRIPLIAVAGSNGKTTVKEMISACLRATFGDSAVLATQGNLNNHIGLPLTLLALREVHRAAVVEIGMNHPGETARLAEIAAPTVALVNNAQREHQEFMRSVADVAEEHASLIRALPEDGVAVINGDDVHAGLWKKAAAQRRVRDFGLGGDVSVQGVCRAGPASSVLEVRTPEARALFELPLAGEHNARNALGAIAAATAAGVPLAACTGALSRFAAVKGRLQLKSGQRGSVLIDDTYNANPDSVRAAIDVLAGMQGRRLLVLGDMGEVGTQGTEFHEEVGAHAKRSGIDALYALGDLALAAARAFGSGGRHYSSIEDLLADVGRDLGPKTVLLVKGSRFMKMERVVHSFEVPATGGIDDAA